MLSNGFRQFNNRRPNKHGGLIQRHLKADFEQIKQIAPRKILQEHPLPEFQLMVACGHLETPIATTEL